MNNYLDESEKEPIECPTCFSSMTEQQSGDLKCDNPECNETIESSDNE